MELAFNSYDFAMTLMRHLHNGIGFFYNILKGLYLLMNESVILKLVIQMLDGQFN